MREICCFHFYFSAGLWWYLSACLYVLYYHGTLRLITNVKYSSLHAECLAGWCALSLLLLTLISSIITKIFKSCFHLMILRTFEVIWRLLRWWWPDLRCLSFEVHNISLDLLHCAVCIMVHVSDGYMGILSNEIYFPGSINNKECFLFRSCFFKKKNKFLCVTNCSKSPKFTQQMWQQSVVLKRHQLNRSRGRAPL